MHKVISVSTNGKGTYDITREVEEIIAHSGVQDGQVCVFVQHTSASLVFMENGDPRSRRDLEEYFERLVPEDTPYFIHTDEGPDDMPSHIRMVLSNPSQTIPIIDGQPALGIWQSLYLFEHRRAPHRRSIIVSIVGA